MNPQMQSWKFVALIAECLQQLPSGFLQRWIENPQAMTRFLAGLRTPPPFPTWVILGEDTSIRFPDDLRRIVAASGWRVSEAGRYLLDSPHLTVSMRQGEVKVVKATVRELGFDAETHLDVVLQRIISLGHNLCESAEGIRLMARYSGESDLTIAMRCIKNTRGLVEVFRIGDRTLHAVSGHEGASFLTFDI